MPHRRAKSPTLVEVMIVIAIVGIMISMAASQGKRAHRPRPGRAPAPQARVSTEGRGNTIEAPATRRRGHDQGSAVSGLSFGRLVWIVLVVSVIIWVWARWRQSRSGGSGRRPTLRKHPPDAEE